MIRLYLKILKNVMHLIFLDGFWLVYIEWSNFSLLHNPQWITFPTLSGLYLYSFCASLLNMPIILLTVSFLSPYNLNYLEQQTFAGYQRFPMLEHLSIIILRSVIWVPRWFGFGFNIFHRLSNVPISNPGFDYYLCSCHWCDLVFFQVRGFFSGQKERKKEMRCLHL